ncbi:MAG: hypothetical protein CR982_06910 [Candidatus Cloacimonadota bacterium]|nr:MAG: hypothetical protein CR982_06910 [Candidatus Cloacimonadota bacterium]PIE77786.1 MAG: hypothetical protein CSA15_10855 [Candidatus Delongbacteria bacterium]
MILETVDYIFYTLLSLDKADRLVSSLHFFVYDTIKIMFLLLLITHIMGAINLIFPVDRVRVFLSNRKMYGLEYFLASLLGAVTPFCSCSSIPLFLGFVKGGIPLGVTLSFLITSPLINEVAVTLFIGVFGLKVTAIYVASGLILGTIGGMVLGKLKLENQLQSWVTEMNDINPVYNKKDFNIKKAFKEISTEAFAIIKKIYIYILIGIGIGATIHGYVPAGFFEEYITKDNIFAVPLSVILAVPIYTNASGVIPVIQALTMKGIPMGTALAFMMAAVGLSLPEALMLKKAMKVKLLIAFFGTTTLFIIISGYLFNLVM